MTVNDILGTIRGTVICGDVDKRFEGVYVGDLLSRAMSHVESDAIWVTIMSNVNVVAVASLADVACVIFAEGVEPDEQAKTRAENEGINLMSSKLAAYELSVRLSALI